MRKINILVTKTMEETEESKIIKTALKNITSLVKNWIESKVIEGVFTDDEIVVNLSNTYIEEWISSVKLTGNNKRQYQIFMSAVTNNSFGALIKD